jgi:hypothetical protein
VPFGNNAETTRQCDQAFQSKHLMEGELNEKKKSIRYGLTSAIKVHFGGQSRLDGEDYFHLVLQLNNLNYCPQVHC